MEEQKCCSSLSGTVNQAFCRYISECLLPTKSVVDKVEFASSTELQDNLLVKMTTILS